jgi:hypothetical protein
VITAQLLLMLLITAVIRHNRQHLETNVGQRMLTRRPLAAGAFIGFFIFIGAFNASPPAWAFMIGVIIVVSGAALVGSIENRQWEGQLFYGLAIFVCPHRYSGSSRCRCRCFEFSFPLPP